MKKEVFAYLHTHWDREWYRTFEEFRLRLLEVFDDILLKLEKDEIPFFYFDAQTSFLQDYLEINPQNKSKIKNFIEQKKLFIGPFFCSTDSFLVNAMSYVKNLDIGIQQAQDFGCNDYIGYLSDTFGHSYSIPEILKFFNIKNAFLWRGLGNTPSIFDWNDINTIYLKQGYFHDYLSLCIDIEKKTKLIENQLIKIDEENLPVLIFPLGADHLACPENISTQIEQINNHLINYKLVLKTPFEYLEKIKKIQKTSFFDEFRDNSKNFILPGVYSSRIDIKQQNAICQWLLYRIAEPLTLFDNQQNFNNSLIYATKELLKNQAHDSIYGCCIDEVHTQNFMRYEKIKQVTNGVIKRIERNLSCESEKITAINLSNFTYNGAIKITTDKKLKNVQLVNEYQDFSDKKLYSTDKIPITEDYSTIYEYLIDVKNLKPFSLKTLEETDINTNSKLNIAENYIENDFIALKIKDKKLVLIDKLTNTIYNDFIKIIDKADVGDSYNFAPVKNDKPIIADLIFSKVKETGKTRCILEVIYEIEIPEISLNNARINEKNKHILKVNLILYAQSKYLQVNIIWENKSKNHLLQIAFNLKKPVTETISEDMLGTVKRQINPDYNIEELIPLDKGKEMKTNTFPMQRFVFTQNFGLITKGLNEYEIYKNELKLTILRSTGIISNPKNSARTTPAGPPLKTPDLQLLKKCSADFAICFVNDPNELFEITEYFYYPIVSVFGENKNRKIIEIENKNLFFYGIIYKNKEKNLLVFNNCNKKIDSKIKFFDKEKMIEIEPHQLIPVSF